VSQYLAQARAERSLLLSFAVSPIAISFRTLEMALISCNAAYEALSGRTEEELLGTGLELVVPPSEVAAIQAAVEEEIDSGTLKRESEFQRPDGTIVWVDTLATMVSIPSHPEPVVLTYSLDKTERRRSQQLLEYQASHDELTGLPNRREFLGQCNTELSRKNEWAVLMLDLDRFKEVNDLYGHSAGDQMLIASGFRFARATP